VLRGQLSGVLQWTNDRLSATPWTRVYIACMRLARDKAAFQGSTHTLRVTRERQAEGDASPGRATRLRYAITSTEFQGMTLWRVRPRRRLPVARVVYLHGGGYVHPLTKDYWRLVRALAAAPTEVIVPAYPLAPGATVDEVLPRLARLVHETSMRSPTLPLVLMGDSAGGALALQLARRLGDQPDRVDLPDGSRRGAPIAGVVALCPWLDATLDQDEVSELEATDPMLAESGLRAAGRWWAGPHDPSEPVISPVHMALEGLPPVDLFIGDRDILRPAVDELAERARHSPVELAVHESPAMFHVWMTRFIPEGRRTRRTLARLARERSRAAAES